MLGNNMKSYWPFSLWLTLTTILPEFLLLSLKLAYLNAVIPARLKQQQPKLTLEKIQDSG